MSVEKNFKVALIQMKIIDDKKANLKKAEKLIREAAINKVDIVCLPEMFNCPYRPSKFKLFAEKEGEETLEMIKELAKENNIYIVAGSIPEKEDEKIYNTSYTVDNYGKVIGKYRKLHLFDVDIPGGVSIRESDVFTPGDKISVIETPFCKIGVCICYDLRFPEIFRIMESKGAKIIFIPAAFNKKTGKKHWETLIKSRAIDSQIYIAAVSPAYNRDERYEVYGHSKITDPYGNTMGELEEGEEILYGEINLNRLEKIRSEFPVLKHRRMDIYEVVKK